MVHVEKVPHYLPIVTIMHPCFLNLFLPSDHKKLIRKHESVLKRVAMGAQKTNDGSPFTKYLRAILRGMPDMTFGPRSRLKVG